MRPPDLPEGAISGRGRRIGEAGRICHRPLPSSPSRAVKQAGESNRGSANQSTDPSFDTSAAVSASPSSA
jgi:hypothetical protein